MRGFEYQKLKTAKAWLENYRDKKEESIYCDYQEDIMQRDFTSQTVKFTQIKSYAKKLSLGSEEIQKAVFNFFMLFTKPEYFLDEVVFLFESTSGIANERNVEESSLLKDWAANQEQLTPELLKKCSQKTKSIVQKILQIELDTAFKKLAEKKEKIGKKLKENETPELLLQLKNAKEKEESLKETKQYFDELGDDTFESFTQKIRWEFTDTLPDIAFNQLIATLEELANSLPSISTADLGKMVLPRLHWEVSQKSVQPEPSDRVLTTQLLDTILLSLGEDEWYVQIREKYRQAQSLAFQIGEFYEIISTSTNCKQHIYLKDDVPFWIGLIEKYLGEENVPAFIKHQARFEICYLSLQLDTENYEKHGTLKGKEELLKAYFNAIEKHRSINDIEAAVVLFGLTASTAERDGLNISQDEIKTWETSLTQLIDNEIQAEKNKNHLCSLFELRGLMAIRVEFKNDTLEAVKSGLSHYEKILPLLPEATLYPILRLKKRLLKQVDIFIRLNLAIEQGLFLEFVEKIRPYFKHQESEFNDAEDNRDLGWAYFENRDYRKAIHYGQKAKDQWFNQESFEGAALTLLSLTQMYSVLGMQLAAKYQALAAAHLVIHSDDHSLLKYLPQAFALGANADFRQGAWINFLDLFDLAIWTHTEMDVDVFDLEQNELLRKTISDLGSVIYVTDKIFPEISHHIESRLNRWPDIQDMLTLFVPEIENALVSNSINDVWKFLDGRVRGIPFNDVGGKRIIFWKALGIEWELEFQNDFLTNSVAEQVAAVIQIVLVDLAEVDFHLIPGQVKIEFEVAEVEKIQLESGFLGEKIIWKVKQPPLKEKHENQAAIRNSEIVSLACSILADFSLLSKDEQSGIIKTHMKNGLMSKTLFIQPYEKIYGSLLSEDVFNLSNRQNLQNPNQTRQIEFYESKYLQRKTGISPKYDGEKTKEHIDNRYTNCVKSIRMTLEGLVKIDAFQETIRTLKSEGWKDWHLLRALSDIVTNFKANHIINQQFPNHPKEILVREFDRITHELVWQEETESYVEIPLDEFSIEKIRFTLFFGSVSSLRSYGLVCNSPIPDVQNIYELLVKRFRYLEDDVEHLNIFHSNEV